ncbi:MAG: peptidoglycan endopeptidase [Mycobacterium sp.]|nr:peptidoglycan endopeptidase [Mycobacterium sp.]
MFAIVSLMSLISQVSGTPYISGGDSPAGTDCSGLASWVANVASGRPAFGSRFNTGNIEPALLARGFQYGSAPNSVVIGWNSGHAAVTLPDGTPVSSGESGRGVQVGGGGAYQPQFSHHMFLPVEVLEMQTDEAQPQEMQIDELAAPADLQGDPGAEPDAQPVGNAPLVDTLVVDNPVADIPGAGAPVVETVDQEVPAPMDGPEQQAPNPEPAPGTDPVVVIDEAVELPA